MKKQKKSVSLYTFTGYAEHKAMSFGMILSLTKSVITAPEVLLTVGVVILYLSLVFYVARYRRSALPPFTRKKEESS